MKIHTPAARPEYLENIRKVKTSAFILLFFCISLMVLVSIGLLLVHPRHVEDINTLRIFHTERSGIIPASRGRILDRNGDPIVDNRIISRLFVNPSRVNPALRVPLAQLLSENFGIGYLNAIEKITGTGSTLKVLIPDMTSEQEERFEHLRSLSAYRDNLKEVGISRQEARVYPNGGIAGPVIGFTASREQGQDGLWGLESAYDELLSGRPGAYRDVRDQRGERIPGTRVVTVPPRNGSDLILTLDPCIQNIASYALAEKIEETGAKGGIVIVVEPSTGDIRALVSLPAFDPENFQDYLDDEEAMFSRSTCLSYEPGSVMKIFTISAGLKEGVIEPDDILHVTNGPLRFNGGSVPDHSYAYGPDQSIETIIVHSSNRGAGLVARELGGNRLIDWLGRFGFGTRTCLGLPGEPEGYLKHDVSRLPEIDLVNMGFGQGMTVTPIQLIQAMSVFANDGVLVPLRLIDARIDPLWGGMVYIPMQETHRVLDVDTARTMENFMVRVVSEGTATTADTEWVSAGKTGTSQKINPSGGYEANKFFATFIGYGPVENPQWMILVILDEPRRPNHYGGLACGPVYKSIFTALMLKYGDNESQDEPEPEPNPVQEISVESTVTGESAGLEIIENNGIVISADPFGSMEGGE